MYNRFNVDFLTTDPVLGGSWGTVPSDIKIEHKFHSATRLGGCNVAEMELTGDPIALADCLMWLRRPVEVYNPDALKVWWGFVREVRFQSSGSSVALSLDNMANKVKVIYTYKQGIDYVTGDTGWVSDTLSQSHYGIKEYVHSLGEDSLAGALATQAAALDAIKIPKSDYSNSGTGGATRVTIICSGWFETLRWRTFQRLEGKMEYEPTDTDREQLIGWQYVGSNISFEVTGTTPDFIYSIKSTTPDFVNVPRGSILKLTGSASNNATYTVDSILDSGATLQVIESVVNESAGASVTILAVGYETAQRFQATSTFVLDRLAVDVQKYGTPGDLIVGLRADSSGSPGSSLVTGNVLESEVGITGTAEVWATMSTDYTVTSGTYYWVCVRKAGGLSATDHYTVRLYGESYSLTQGYTGSSWTDFLLSTGFKIHGKEANELQISRIVTDAGQFFRRLESFITTGLKTNQYRDGYKTAYENIVGLLAQGDSAGRRFVVNVTPERVLQIRLQDEITDDIGQIDEDGVIREFGGVARGMGDLPVARWLAVNGFPIQIGYLLQISPLFVEEARWVSSKPDRCEVKKLSITEYKVRL